MKSYIFLLFGFFKLFVVDCSHVLTINSQQAGVNNFFLLQTLSPNKAKIIFNFWEQWFLNSDDKENIQYTPL